MMRSLLTYVKQNLCISDGRIGGRDDGALVCGKISADQTHSVRKPRAQHQFTFDFKWHSQFCRGKNDDRLRRKRPFGKVGETASGSAELANTYHSGRRSCFLRKTRRIYRPSEKVSVCIVTYRIRYEN